MITLSRIDPGGLALAFSQYRVVVRDSVSFAPGDETGRGVIASVHEDEAEIDLDGLMAEQCRSRQKSETNVSNELYGYISRR
ncbi:MAG: hypothetical protein ACR65T_15200 [Methylocystis sp.]|uniref:hypothetical protein n=1 Tax=Methylocystis sp. TaxID=1911079 RepID=UPI003DA588A0